MDNLRCLGLLQYYASNTLTAVSDFNYWTEMCRNNPELLLTLSVPRDTKKEWATRFFKYDYTDAELEAIRQSLCVSNLKFERMALSRDYFDAEDPLLFNEDEWKYLLWKNLEKQNYDVVISHRFGLSSFGKLLQYKRGSQYGSTWKVPWITYFHEMWGDESSPTLSLLEGSLQMVTDAVIADRSFVFNDRDKDTFLEKSKMLLSDYYYNGIVRKLYVVRPIIAYDEIDRRRDAYEINRTQRLESGKINLFHAGSLEAGKQWDMPLELLETMKSMNVCNNVEYRINITSEHSEKQLKDKCGNFNWVVVSKHSDRTEYFNLIGDGDIGLSLSPYKGTGIANEEWGYSGMLMIAWKSDWMMERMPKNYPFFVKSKTELSDVLIQLSDVKEFKAMKEEWCPKIIEKKTELFCRQEAERTFGLIREAVDGSFNDDKSHLFVENVVKNVAENFITGIQCSETEVYNIIGLNMKKYKGEKVLKSSLPVIALRRFLRKHGIKDVGDLSNVVYEK